IPQAFTNHRFPDRRRREKRRQWGAAGIDRAIGKEEESRAPAAAQRGSRKLSKTAARPRDSSCDRKCNINSLLGAKNRSELGQLASGNHGARQRDPVLQVNIERHDVGLAQRIDWRICDLREPLLTVIPQSPWKRRKKSRRRVVSHAPIRSFATSQGGKENVELVLGPAGGARDALRLSNRNWRCSSRCSQLPLWNGIARLLNREALEDVTPAQKKPGGRVGQNHFTGTKPLALGNPRFVQVHEPGLGSSDQQAVMRQCVAQRPQSIAIELGTDELSIRKDQRGRTIPRLGALRKRGKRTAHIA